jgi:hypothetical protein
VSSPSADPFSSPLTGRHFNISYSSNALVNDLPLNEAGRPYQHCNIYKNTGCTHIPITDEGTPAAFYPYFYSTHVNGCTWGEGTDGKGLTVDDFGKVNQ